MLIISLSSTTVQGQALLDEYVSKAVQDNPRLSAALQKVQMVERTIPQAGALPDPQLSLGLMNLPVNSFAFNQEPMTGKTISVMQMFPFPGKLSLATDIAELNTAIARWQEQEVRNQIVALVKRVYFDLYAIDRTIETIESNQLLMEQFVSVAETKYATGSGLQQDVLRAQVELSKLGDDLIMWQQKRRSAVAKLNALLNRSADVPVPTTQRDLQQELAETTKDSELQIVQNRPLLKAWSEVLEKAEIEIKLAHRDYWPNFSIGVGYSQRDDLKNGAVMHDFFSATVSLNVPLYFKRKQSAKVQQKEISLIVMRSEFQNVRNQVFADIENWLAELERNRKRAQLYEGGILIQAQQSLESALSGYQVGKVDFLTLINNWLMLQNYELQYYRALADYYKALASYEFAVGKNWEF